MLWKIYCFFFIGKGVFSTKSYLVTIVSVVWKICECESFRSVVNVSTRSTISPSGTELTG